MRGWWGISVYMLLLVLSAQNALAESPMDTHSKPSVEVDETVLQELKDYTPPPMMFDAAPTASAPPIETEAPLTSPPAPIAPPSEPTLSAPAPTIAPPAIKKDVQVKEIKNADGSIKKRTIIREIPTKKIHLPQKRSLTAPKAEDILAHPVENFHVLTVQQPPHPTPASSPKSDTKTDVKKDLPLPAVTPVKKVRVAPPPPPAHLMDSSVAKVTPKPYIPKTAKSMPAVGTVNVEKSPLPPPAGVASSRTASTDKVIDKALARNMVSDDAAIKDTLVKKSDSKGGNDSKNPAAPAQVFSLSFSTDSSETDGVATGLTHAHITALDKNALSVLEQDKKIRVSITAYATSPDNTSGTARRISLSRALAVRQYLVDKGVAATRIDLKALGDSATGTPKNRVDIKVK